MKSEKVKQVAVYGSEAGRSKAIAALVKKGFNYFVKFVDKKKRLALLWTKSSWASRKGHGKPYIVGA